MLKIYTDVSKVPAGSIIIKDSEVFFYGELLQDIESTRNILSAIEQGSYLDEEYFESRFGEKLPRIVLSTSSKTLINITQNTDSKYIFECIELNLNALDYLLECCDGAVFFSRRLLSDLPEWIDVSSIIINDKSVNSLEEMEELLC